MKSRKATFLRALLFLFFVTTIEQAYADYGSMILHKAKFVLKDGSSVTGYVPLHNYNVSMADYKDLGPDKAFQKLLNKYFFEEFRTLEFRVFKKYKTMISPGKSPNPYEDEFLYTDSTSVRTLHLDSIKYTVYLNGQDMPCLFWRQIEVFDLNTVNLMEHTSIQHFSKVSLYASENFFVDAHIFCFNPNISGAAFKEAIRNFGKKTRPKLRADYINYLEEAKALEKMGIVVFFWSEGNC